MSEGLVEIGIITDIDVKAMNILVDDNRDYIPRCVISDFGQSEMKNDAYT